MPAILPILFIVNAILFVFCIALSLLSYYKLDNPSMAWWFLINGAVAVVLMAVIAWLS